MPVRSPRAIYLIKGMTSNTDDEIGIIDNLPGSVAPKTTKPVYAKMKESVGDFLGLTQLAYDDIAFQGTFGGNGLNKGYKYIKNIGGFREASYTLIAKTTFPINEIIYNKTTKTYSRAIKNFATISIGFPKGHSFNEFLAFLATTSKLGEVRAVRTPKGRRFQVSDVF